MTSIVDGTKSSGSSSHSSLLSFGCVVVDNCSPLLCIDDVDVDVDDDDDDAILFPPVVALLLLLLLLLISLLILLSQTAVIAVSPPVAIIVIGNLLSVYGCVTSKVN